MVILETMHITLTCMLRTNLSLIVVAVACIVAFHAHLQFSRPKLQLLGAIFDLVRTA